MNHTRENAIKHIGIVACSAEGAALCYRGFILLRKLLLRQNVKIISVWDFGHAVSDGGLGLSQ